MIAVSPAAHNLYRKLGQGELITRPKNAIVFTDANNNLIDVGAYKELLTNRLVVVLPHGLGREKLVALPQPT